MDTRTRPGEHVKLALLGELSEAAQALARPGLDDEAVHDARRKLKSARAGLRLLRPLDERLYRHENARLRDAARRLSAIRDGKVLVGALAALLETEKKPSRRRLLQRARAQATQQREIDWRAVCAAPVLGEIAQSMRESATRIETLPSPRDGASPLAEALGRIYRKGRKALKRSRRKPTDARLHEARKQAKHLANALELLAGAKPCKRVKKALHLVSQLHKRLGDDHDLAVVEAALADLPPGAGKGRRSLRRRLDERRARLQEKALEAGDKLFRRRTRKALREAAA